MLTSVGIAVWQVAASHAVDLIEMRAQGVDVGQRVHPSSTRRDLGLGDEKVGGELPDPTVGDAQDARDLTGSETPERLGLGRREHDGRDLAQFRTEQPSIVAGGCTGSADG